MYGGFTRSAVRGPCTGCTAFSLGLRVSLGFGLCGLRVDGRIYGLGFEQGLSLGRTEQVCHLCTARMAVPIDMGLIVITPLPYGGLSSGSQDLRFFEQAEA